MKTKYYRQNITVVFMVGCVAILGWLPLPQTPDTRVTTWTMFTGWSIELCPTGTVGFHTSMHSASGPLSCARSWLTMCVYLLPESVFVLCRHRQALQNVFLFNNAQIECLSIFKTSESILMS